MYAIRSYYEGLVVIPSEGGATQCVALNLVRPDVDARFLEVEEQTLSVGGDAEETVVGCAVWLVGGQHHRRVV